jgi:hypothetical protein
MSRKVMAAILAHREVAPLLSDDHFSVDGTLVKAWASMKSFQPKAGDPPPDEDPGSLPGPDSTATDHPKPSPSKIDSMPRPDSQFRNAEVNFRGEKQPNATHVSTTDPDARLDKKSPDTGAVLCFIGHALMENCSGLIVKADLTQADGHAERRAALDMIHRHSPGSTQQLTLGYDRGYDSADFVRELRRVCVTPHVAQKSGTRPSTAARPGTQAPPFPRSTANGSKTLRLGQDRRWPGPVRLPRRREGRRPLRPDDGRQQHRPPAPAAGSVTEIGWPDRHAHGTAQATWARQPTVIGKPSRHRH